MRKIAWKALVAGAMCLSAAASCGGGGDDKPADGGKGAGPSIGTGGGLNFGGGTSTGGGQSGGAASCAPAPDDTGCVGAAFEGENIPLDIYVMFDLSCSMSCNVDHSGCCRESDNPDPPAEWRILPVRQAMKAFLQDPASAGLGVGLGFFGDHS